MAVYLGVSITQNSQSIANNTSNVTVSVYCSWTGGSYNRQTNNGVPQAGGWVNIDGAYYYFNSTFNDNRTTTGSKTLYTKVVNIEHANNGKKTLICSSQFATGVSSGTISASNSLKLTDIPRFATIVSAPNFNDEENPTITYSNPAGNNVASLQACISLDISKDDIAYRDINKTGSSYTFNLTAAERDVLRAATTSNSRTVYFFVRSTIGDAKDTDRLARTLTIKNPNPTINPTITDSNSTTVALTGNSSVLVKYYSNAAVTIGAAAVKKASLKSQKAVCGNKSLTANGTMTAVESNSFVFTATDSRGNTTTKTVTPSFINYIKLSCSLGNNMPSTDGKMTVQATGNYFNGSFGAKSNSLNVYYRYKTAGGSYSSWAAMTVTKSGNAYSATASLTGLDYQTTYVIQTYAQDALATVYSVEKNIKATPVFDWSKDDFVFNVPVNVKKSLGVYETLNVGDKLQLYTDGEGGNINIGSGNGHTNAWQIDAHDGSLRFYTWRESDGSYREFKFDQEGRVISSGSLINAWPVNSIYYSYSHTSPASLFGGTWTRIESCFLWALTANGTIGSRGGSQWHTLTIDEMPSHNHALIRPQWFGVDGDGNISTRHGTGSIFGYTGTVTNMYKTVQADYNEFPAPIVKTGSGKTYSQMPPYIEVSVWRRTA